MKKIVFFLLVSFLSTQAVAQKFENLALTPPMGWNSWNKFGCDVSEILIKEIADAMVSTGMKDAGYEDGFNITFSVSLRSISISLSSS